MFLYFKWISSFSCFLRFVVEFKSILRSVHKQSYIIVKAVNV